MLAASKAVMIATVVRVGRPPGAWSGIIATGQTVHFRVDEGFGVTVVPELPVGYLIAQPDALIDKKTPQVSPAVFKTGAKLIVFLTAPPRFGVMNAEDPMPDWYSLEAKCAALPASEEFVAELRKQIRAHKRFQYARPLAIPGAAK